MQRRGAAPLEPSPRSSTDTVTIMDEILNVHQCCVIKTTYPLSKWCKGFTGTGTGTGTDFAEIFSSQTDQFKFCHVLRVSVRFYHPSPLTISHRPIIKKLENHFLSPHPNSLTTCFNTNMNCKNRRSCTITLGISTCARSY